MDGADQSPLLAYLPQTSQQEAAKKLLAVGESPRDATLNEAELAAWTTVASTILNLDETITKG